MPSDLSTNYLIIDPVTSDDLNLFGSSGQSEADDLSLYSYCNRCRTQGGEQVLKRRMRAPWSDAPAIENTQKALLFVNRHDSAFAELPPTYVVGNVDDYTRDGVPIIQDRGLIEFASDAFSLWANEDRFYIRINKGVALSCRMIRALRRFLQLIEDEPQQTKQDAGELEDYLDELNTLLSQPGFDAISSEDAERRFWHTLRLDQTFRLHQPQTLRRILEIVYEIDALASLAHATREHSLLMPEINPEATHISAEQLVHPFVPDAVANPVELNQSKRLLFLTGPNMAGKTTYLRAVATALYLAHLGMGVPATRFSFAPVQHLLTAISMSDDLHDGISYFRAEALRLKAVAQAIAEGQRVIAIMDEPFKGTNVKDAFDASVAVLSQFSTKDDCLFMVSSHLIEVSDEFDQSMSVDYQYFEAEESAQKLRFDYVLHPGVSSQRLGMRVLREEGIFELLEKR